MLHQTMFESIFYFENVFKSDLDQSRFITHMQTN